MSEQIGGPRFDHPNRVIPGQIDPAVIFEHALTVSVDDLALAAQASREEAIRYRSVGQFDAAEATIEVAVTALKNRMSLCDPTALSPDDTELPKELIGTLLLHADISATTGNHKATRASLVAAQQANRQLPAGERVDLTEHMKASYTHIAAIGSLANRAKAKISLRNVTETLETAKQPVADVFKTKQKEKLSKDERRYQAYIDKQERFQNRVAIRLARRAIKAAQKGNHEVNVRSKFNFSYKKYDTEVYAKVNQHLEPHGIAITKKAIKLDMGFTIGSYIGGYNETWYKDIESMRINVIESGETL